MGGPPGAGTTYSSPLALLAERGNDVYAAAIALGPEGDPGAVRESRVYAVPDHQPWLGRPERCWVRGRTMAASLGSGGRRTCSTPGRRARG